MSINPVYHQTSSKLDQERVWVQRAKKNPEDFGPLYRKYHEQIFRYVHQRMDDTEQAFDVTSQVFLKAIKNIHKFEFRGVPFGSWLYRIAKSELYQAFRDRKVKRAVNIETLHITEIIEEMDEVISDENQKRLFNAIAQLSDEDVQILELRYFEKRPYKEIGEILDITENNAKVKSFRVIEKLKKIIFKN